MASARSMHEAGHPKLMLWDNPEGWSGDGGGRGIQEVDGTQECGQFMLVYGKNHQNTVIIFQLKLII